MKFKEVVKLIEADGWYRKRTSGSHHVYRHPAKRGIVIVANHGPKDIPIGTLKSILRQAGLDT